MRFLIVILSTSCPTGNELAPRLTKNTASGKIRENTFFPCDCKYTFVVIIVHNFRYKIACCKDIIRRAADVVTHKNNPISRFVHWLDCSKYTKKNWILHKIITFDWLTYYALTTTQLSFNVVFSSK